MLGTTITRRILVSAEAILIVATLIFSVDAETYNLLVVHGVVLIEEAGVVLQQGTAGTSIIYARGTSAKVTVAPSPTRFHYPSGYNIVAGSHVSGSVPSSVQNVDSDYFIVSSALSATLTMQYYPSGYSLLGSTTYVSGSLADLASNDGAYMTFRSYGTVVDDLKDYVDQQSNVDGSADKGTHSNFAALQAGPDNTFDTLTEAVTSWSYNTITFDSAASIALASAASTMSWSHTTGTGNNRILLVDIGVFNDRGTPATVTSVTYGGTALTLLATDVYSTNPQVRSYLYYLVNPSPGTNTISVTFSSSTLAVGGSVTYFNVNQTNPFQTSGTSKGSGTNPSIVLTAAGDYNKVFYANLMTYRAGAYSVTEGVGQTNRWQQTGYTYKGRGSEKAVTAGQQTMAWTLSKTASFVCIGAILVPVSVPSNYELDLEMQWTNVDYNKENKYLCVYVGTQSGYESLKVDVWTGSSWTNLGILNFPNQWNNFSVSSYLTSSTFTIRFRGGTETGDTTQDSWNIDCVLLHTWNTLYTAEVEFTGASNATLPWSQLAWTVDSCLTEASVNVTLQLFDYQANQYPTNGDGYISYTSSATPNTDETKSQTITTNPERFRDSLGNWKIKVKCAKKTSTQFDFKADWVKFETYTNRYKASTEFLFTGMPVDTPAQLNVTIVSHYNVNGVEVTIQLWNYASNSYAESGEGCLRYVSSGVNETKTLTITVNPEFYTCNGEAKIKLTALKTSASPFQQEINKVELCFHAFKYDYVLKIVNQVSNNWRIRLRAYGQTDITRLSSCIIYLHTFNGASNQVIIIDGEYTQQQGEWFDLTGLSTAYIAVTVSVSNVGASRIYVYLEALVPNTTTCNLMDVTFEIS